MTAIAIADKGGGPEVLRPVTLPVPAAGARDKLGKLVAPEIIHQVLALLDEYRARHVK